MKRAPFLALPLTRFPEHVEGAAKEPQPCECGKPCWVPAAAITQPVRASGAEVVYYCPHCAPPGFLLMTALNKALQESGLGRVEMEINAEGEEEVEEVLPEHEPIVPGTGTVN